ncbi:MAG TPA: phosphoglucomutase/phosphomannomutase family protein [Bacteroidia bacterium]|nr:phosphoglucomutase/phosphomannomutase family protein [Bacteroidia bacterium]
MHYIKDSILFVKKQKGVRQHINAGLKVIEAFKEPLIQANAENYPLIGYIGYFCCTKQRTMSSIKFGTDGWRAIIAEDYTIENVTRVAEATARWLLKNNAKPTVVVGYDCRFGGKMFAETVTKVLAYYNIRVFLSTDFVSTPMTSLGVLHHKATVGVIITASHNPGSYNGYKLKGSYGGPLLAENVKEIEELIDERSSVDTKSLDLKGYIDKKLVQYTDLETLYVKQVEKNFDLKLIKKSGLNLAYDSMYGAGQNVIKRLFPDATLLHCVNNPSFGGTAPEPIERNLQEFESLIKKSKNVDFGLATDGDADRIGVYNGKGHFIDSHNIILLLVHYLVAYKKMKGKVCVAFSVTEKIKKISKHYNLPLEVVKVGFKYICGVMISEDVLIGAEESGGMAIKGHIPERDGIWIGLTLLEFMAKTGKSIDELIKEVTKITGKFAYKRIDMHITEEKKQQILKNCKEKKFTAFGKFKVEHIEDLDGYKFFFNPDEWMMIRASGTEPVLRLYAEASSDANADAILAATCKVVG